MSANSSAGDQAESHHFDSRWLGEPPEFGCVEYTVETGVVTCLVAVAGTSPGAGKSTLCAGIADWLRTRRLEVDHFREEEVLTRDEFGPLAREFTATGEVQLSTLLETTERYLAGAMRQGVDVALTDALVPFVPSPMGWGYDQAAMTDFLKELAGRISAATPIVVYLDDDPAAAVPRAVEREGAEWKDWLLRKLGQYPVEPAIRDLDTACGYLRHERDVTLRLLAQLPWQVIVLEQTSPPSPTGVLHIARERLARALAQLNE